MSQAEIVDLFGPREKKKRQPLSEERKRKIGANSKAAHARKRDGKLKEIQETGCITCSKCLETKPTSNFTRDRHRGVGYRAQCKHCNGDYYRRKGNEYYHANRDKIIPKRFWYYKKGVHGVTKEQYLEILASQYGSCAICKEIPKEKALCVDHNHETKKIRGLLCHRCNSAIGLLKDSITVIKNAASYLEERGNYGKA